MKISELRPGGEIELRAEINSIQPIRKLWKCFKCGNKGMWRKEEEFSKVCPDCGAEESSIPKQGMWVQNVRSILIKDDSGMAYLDLWHEEADGYMQDKERKMWQIGDKIHLINGYARENSSGGVNVSKGKFGSLRKIE